MGFVDTIVSQIGLKYVCLALLFIWLIRLWLKERYSNLPPGPFNFPVVGCLPFLDQHPERIFSKWAEKYGPVIYMKLGPHRTVVLNSYEAIEQAFVQQNVIFNGRFRTFFTNFACGGDHGIMFLNNQENWKVQRRFGLRGLAGANLQGKSLEARIQEEVELLCDDIRSKNGKPFVLEEELTHSVSNVINGITIQQRCNDKGNEPLMAYVDNVIQGFRRDGFVYMLLTVAPWSRFFPSVRNSFKNMQEGIISGNALFDNLIDQRENELDPKRPNGFVDSFLIEHKKNSPSFEKDLLAAGTETSSSTLRWILIYLIKQPKVQRKAHDEIDRVIDLSTGYSQLVTTGTERFYQNLTKAHYGKVPGREGVVRLDADVPYVRAIIQETYRIQSVVPLGVPRRTTKDTTLLGYHIPKNTQVLSNLWHVHNDPKLWPNPTEFIPERHLDNDGNFMKSDYVIPFSIGPRNCLGENLARMEIFLFFVCMMQKFEVLPNPDNPYPSIEGTSGPVCSSQHYHLIMKER